MIHLMILGYPIFTVKMEMIASKLMTEHSASLWMEAPETTRFMRLFSRRLEVVWVMIQSSHQRVIRAT